MQPLLFRPDRRLRVLSYLFSIGLALLTVPPAAAHEMGTIQAAASFHRGGTWEVAISVDEEHIPPVEGSAPGAAPAHGGGLPAEDGNARGGAGAR